MTSNPRRDVVDFIVHKITFLDNNAQAKGKKLKSASTLRSLSPSREQRTRSPGTSRSGSPSEDDNGETAFLQQVTEDRVLVVDSLDKVAAMRAFFDSPNPSGLRVLGLDAEWRPRALTQEGEEASVCCIQVSDGHKALVIDCVALLPGGEGVQCADRCVHIARRSVFSTGACVPIFQGVFRQVSACMHVDLCLNTPSCPYLCNPTGFLFRACLQSLHNSTRPLFPSHTRGHTYTQTLTS